MNSLHPNIRATQKPRSKAQIWIALACFGLVFSISHAQSGPPYPSAAPSDLLYCLPFDPLATGPTGGIFLLASGHTPRPLAQEHEGIDLGTRQVVLSPQFAEVAGVPTLYFFDREVNGLFRGQDANANGAIDPLEFEKIWEGQSIGATAVTAIDHFAGEFLIAVADGAQGRGLFLLRDHNRDGRYDGLNETDAIVPGGSLGATMLVQGHTVSADAIVSAAFLGDGSVLFFERDDQAVYRWTRNNGQIHSWFRYSDPNGLGQFPINPEIGTTVPVITGEIKRITINRTVQPEVVYLPIADNPNQPITLLVKDANANGNANDAGEVNVYFDGHISPLPHGEIKDAFWSQGSLFVMQELPSTDFVFTRLTDHDRDGTTHQNGEQVLLRTLSRASVGTLGIESFLVVPSGAFATPNCVVANSEHEGLLASGGSLNFRISAIPSALQGPNTYAFMLLSEQLSGRTGLTATCAIGFAFDALTWLQFTPEFAPLFTTGPILQSRIDFPSIPLPAGLPLGLDLAGTAVFFDATGPLGTTQARRLRVR